MAGGVLVLITPIHCCLPILNPASEAKLPYPVYSCVSCIQAVREGARREGSATGVVPLHGPLHVRLPSKYSIRI